MITIASGIIMLGILVFVHELGHFCVAKFCGVKVLKFSLGFGPRLISHQYGETEYMICAIPLGGYVQMLGEGGGEHRPPHLARTVALDQRAGVPGVAFHVEDARGVGIEHRVFPDGLVTRQADHAVFPVLARHLGGDTDADGESRRQPQLIETYLRPRGRRDGNGNAQQGGITKIICLKSYTFALP